MRTKQKLCVYIYAYLPSVEKHTSFAAVDEQLVYLRDLSLQEVWPQASFLHHLLQGLE